MATCKGKDCDREVVGRGKGHGLCSRCYQRSRRYKYEHVCQRKKCKKVFRAATKDRKYCSKRCANLSNLEEAPTVQCKMPGCENMVHLIPRSNGFCAKCVQSMYKGSHKSKCKTCKKQFLSKTKGKKYCSFDCYAKDPKTKARLRAFNKAKEVTVDNVCLNCQKPLSKMTGIKPSQKKKRKFCSPPCRREYFAARFDRWIANPEAINSPQCFDEFLTKEELPCLVAGCDWTGKCLSNHLNVTHGVSVEQFKELAGFNRRTGLVAPDVSRRRSEVAKKMGLGHLESRPDIGRIKAKNTSPMRAEGKEHYKKAMTLLSTSPPLEAVCEHCGKKMEVKPMGKTRRFCSVECRTKAAKGRRFPLVCAYCNKEFMGTSFQEQNSRVRGRPSACSPQCKGNLNAPYAVEARRKKRKRKPK